MNSGKLCDAWCKELSLLTFSCRKTLKLSDGQVRKLKLQIFENENLARFGKTDVNYEITDATPVLILGVMNMTNNKGRRRRETHLSRSKRASFHRSEPCGETYQYLVDLNSLMPGKKWVAWQIFNMF